MYIQDLKNVPVTEIKGIGEERGKILKNMGINSVFDLIYFFPREYEDRSVVKPISDIQDGETATIRAMVVSKCVEQRIRKNLALYKFSVKDTSGSAVITFYNQPFVKNILKPGAWYYFYGRIYKNFGKMEMQAPACDTENKCIVPVYSLTKGMTQNILRKIIKSALEYAVGIEDYMPSEVKEFYGLYDLKEAVRTMHFPDLDSEKLAMARKRLVFDEFFILQLSLFKVRNKLKQEENGFVFGPVPEIKCFIDSLPFELTEDQKNVFREIEEDMESNRVMNRLVQGDVGSGKTVVAVLAMFKAVRNGFQAAYMAPTEILAEQHFKTVSKFLKGFDINVVLLKGGQSKKQREQVLSLIENGEAQIIIGTHALIQEAVSFKSLGLVVTDEQHRFGVRQRAMLAEKSCGVPDVLVMTATPIPRTLAMILYGDLDISSIKTMPKGRIPIKTYAVDESFRERINNFVIKNASEGRQVYIVCPAIEENEENTVSFDGTDLKKAEEYYKEVSQGVFRGFRVGLIHGRMKNAEKEETMKRFSSGEIDILVTTTVIEVGVDVPNAALIVVENAERFGLAQLHQLRGRVGRGQWQSFCVLFNQSKSEVSRERMKVMTNTSDGFIIAQKDLEIRGPGEFFGTKQHGLPILKVANLYEDTIILKEAQKAAGYFLNYEYKMNEKEKNGINCLIMDIKL